MAKPTGQFVANDMDIMLSGQILKFEESWESSQWMYYSEGHGVMLTVARLNAKGQKLKVFSAFAVSAFLWPRGPPREAEGLLHGRFPAQVFLFGGVNADYFAVGDEQRNHD
jgi:hypothetical protein